MGESDVTAVILCGGRGERLRPFTDSLPKPLVPLCGRPILEHIMRYLAAQEITRFVLCVGYRAEAIRQFATTFEKTGWDIRCIDSVDATMTDRLLDAREHVSGPMLMCYGDTLANIDLRKLRAEHRNSSAIATITVYPYYSPFGIVDLDSDNRVAGFSEKP